MMKKLLLVQKGKTYNLYDLPKGFVIKGDVHLADLGLTELPDLSEVVVKGCFWCHGNRLTSLKGAPKEVKGSFWCNDNHLTSLEGAPQKVGGNFNCRNNQLTTLAGAPQTVGDDFLCEDNQLSTLKGAPQEVGGDFYCEHNNLDSLLGLPKMKKKSIIHCDYSAVHKYGLPGTIEARELFENQKYQNEVKIEELREKKCQERMEKEEKATATTKAAFEAWLKNKGKEAPAR